ncbi:MAG: polysaccharide biosynthesis protein [Flavobacteriaceae bacterium CG_4_8_14_3_um_filter_34_10]|nr:polysaccharide biosynthesis protein [Flavobacteriia bacterium]OIP48927.1 MAG: polysaccharide biosynthesis protein [Flavobacteriaceae bacterium CG2_30_34_30]PIQ17722.1 MAG: polysaccharide biosynthesis protein [Flavobacteriaceae bacterium CG18_big_fil_WC_8_21_14_2_50_34_36]PIV51452.1 MAG: polysaccharide biosynthesis protein [Flavobacteriaceae bacterium CG02_land_8_20_14_3_00_34_13]PIX09517.1 MAG: polysaccharide biosynthesis protein [Flavobacteriaceae bacterium CG_4_8_14_3_um_filter_34_10]PIZ0
MYESLLNKFRRILLKGDNKLGITSIRYLPRWIVICIDTSLLVLSIIAANLILQSLQISFYPTFTWVERYGAILVINVFFFMVFKTYAGLIRHSTFTDIVKLLLSSFATGFVLIVLNYIFYFATGSKIYILPGLLIYLIISFSFLLLFRVVIKQVYHLFKENKIDVVKKRVVILGTDDHAISVAEALATDSIRPFELVGFLSKNPTYKNIRILGKPVILFKKRVCENLSKYNVQGILILGDTLSKDEKNDLVDNCLENGLLIFNVPVVEQWNSDTELTQQIKVIQIEDLLNREVIALDNRLIEEDLNNKVILITGGAGSIGSEMVRQIAKFNPGKLVILDQAETPLYNLELELNENFPELNFVTELANISNMYRLVMLFEQHQFDMIYHAAAYKHVPIIERNPHEAIYVNILGTMNLVKLAIANNVSKFVMISTDKAVNPTNVMGASKRAAEMYVQSIQKEKGVNTLFITTRFGNVLGSNGSVIPHFKRQIAKGGPVTVTHPDIIRYFMTIPEACQLVLQAGTMGKGGEIFVFDMGKPVRIMDLATRMIRLSGLIPEKDIQIKVTGLRPGEKLYEELLADETNHLPTHHNKIMVAKDVPVPFNDLKKLFEMVVKSALKKQEMDVVRILKEIVVEYKSENSEFCELDVK